MTQNELKQNAIQKLKSAKVLLEAGCYNDSIYLAGYSIELALKWKFCHKLNIDFPEKLKDINIKTHNLISLLSICGEESNLKDDGDWSTVTSIKWSESLRYSSEIITEENARNMVHSCNELLKKLII